MRYLQQLIGGLVLVVLLGLGIYWYIHPSLFTNPLEQQTASEQFFRERGTEAGAPTGLPAGQVELKGMPEPVAGTVVAIDGKTLILAGEDGATITTTLADTTSLQTLAEIDIADVQQGESVMMFGSQSGSTFRASQIWIMRGEGMFMGGGIPVAGNAATKESAPPQPFYGIVEHVEEHRFVVKSGENNSNIMIDLNDDGSIYRQQPIKISELHAGDTLTAFGIRTEETIELLQVMKVNPELVPQ